MERLKNKDIFIGREPEQSRLMVTVNINGQPKTAFLGQFHSVPNTVSRCRPLAGTAHCKISVDGNAHMIITNLNPANITYVNNCSVQAKPVTTNEQIQLGANKFPIAVNTIVEIAKNMIPEVPKEYSIKHLENVWNDFFRAKENMRRRREFFNLLNRFFLPLSLVGSLFGGRISVILKNAGLVCLVIGLITSLWDFFTNKEKEDAENLLVDFESKYVCPHCNRYLNGASFQPYRRL